MAPLTPRTLLRARAGVNELALVAPLPYLNFLRHLKTNVFRRYGLRRLLQEAPAYWDALNESQKKMFTPQRIIARLAREARAARARRLLRRALHGLRARPGARVRRPIYDKRPQPQRSKRKPKRK